MTIDLATGNEPRRGRDRLMEIPELQQRLGVSRTTTFELLRSKQIRSVKIGRRRLIPESALLEFIESRPDA